MDKIALCFTSFRGKQAALIYLFNTAWQKIYNPSNVSHKDPISKHQMQNNPNYWKKITTLSTEIFAILSTFNKVVRFNP